MSAHGVAVPSPIPNTSGRYEVGEAIASGGVAIIHRAYDRLAGREVAYKRLKAHSGRSRAMMVAQFQREYDTLARLPHPNIVEVYDYGNDDQGPYYAMEMLSGSDLSHRGVLPYRDVCRILRDVASALALVHARKFVHRDVSPNNIRLTSDGRAKLIDFGALIPFGRAREIIGTIGCMAPECISRTVLDARTDLFSLGAVAYFALTQRLPVRARSLDELRTEIYQPPLPPSAYAPEVPKELDTLVLSLLAPDPLARPSSAAYAIDRLTAIGDLPPEHDERRVAHSYLAFPALAGRDEPMRVLQQAVEAGAAGHGRVLLVESGPGLGRSTLLDSLALQMQLEGVTVLRARGDDRIGAFGVAQVLAEGAVALHPDLQPRLAGDAQPAPAARSAAEAAARHALVISALQTVLLEVSHRHPLLIVVDDAHASDVESLALLASLAHEVKHTSLTIAASALAGHATLETPTFAQFAAEAVRLTLDPLTEAQTIELVQAVFGVLPNARRLGQWLYAQAGGNPATTIDLARLLLSRGLVRYTVGTFTLPHDVDLSTADLANVVFARLGDLDPHTQRVARAMSLHEGALQPERLAAALDLSPSEVLASLEELVARGVGHAVGRGFTFRASSLRTASQSRMPEAERRALHLRLGKALLEAEKDEVDTPFAAGMHLLEGGARSEAAAVIRRIGRTRLHGEIVARWTPVIEAVLDIYRTEHRSKEESLALLIPLVHAGFYGQLETQRRHVDQAIAWMSEVCGMTLAAQLAPRLGGRLALGAGLAYAGFRRTRTPAAARLGTIPQMLAEFVGLVTAGTAAAVISQDMGAAQRFNRWLEPLAALPEDSSGYLLREFCLASAEFGRGDFAASSARYAWLIPRLAKPIRGLDEQIRRTIYFGSLSGRAQAEVAEATPLSLELANELEEGGDPFFMPHVAATRLAYHARRGERALADEHREHLERLALRGGTSWSAASILSIRLAYAAIASRDTIVLVQMLAEFDRLTPIVPNAAILRKYTEAWLECLRGHPGRAVALYEQTIDSERAKHLASRGIDRVLYAAVLNEAGQHTRARAVSEACLRTDPTHQGPTVVLRNALAQLAIAEAGLGGHARAAELMDRVIARALPWDNPLELGNAHRDRARIALRANDRQAFEQHFEAMERYFHATRNPSLIQQCDLLLSEAGRSGVRPDLSLQSTRTHHDAESIIDQSTVIEARLPKSGP